MLAPFATHRPARHDSSPGDNRLLWCGWRELLRSTGDERDLRLSHRRAVSFQSEQRGVQGARNGSSADRKCWQPVELGIHGLNRWLVKCIEMSRKRGVQAARNG